MDGDAERIERLGHVINDRKKALIEGGRLKDTGIGATTQGTSAVGHAKDVLRVLLDYEQVDWEDIQFPVDCIITEAVQNIASGRILPHSALLSMWLDGLFTGLLLQRYRDEDNAGEVIRVWRLVNPNGIPLNKTWRTGPPPGDAGAGMSIEFQRARLGPDG